MLNLPYEGYNSSQVIDNGSGQPASPWQQLPGDVPGVDSTSFTALLNSPFDSFTTNLTPTAATPMAEMPVAQAAVHNIGHAQAPQYGTATGYRPQTAHVMIRPKPTPNVSQNDGSDDDEDEDEPIPKRKRGQREGPRRLPPYLREIQAQAAKRQAERYAAAQGQNANPQNSTVDLTNGKDHFLHYLALLSFLANFETLQSTMMFLRPALLIPKRKKFAMA
jgi:hypothetical protein